MTDFVSGYGEQVYILPVTIDPTFVIVKVKDDLPVSVWVRKGGVGEDAAGAIKWIAIAMIAGGPTYFNVCLAAAVMAVEVTSRVRNFFMAGLHS